VVNLPDFLWKTIKLIIVSSVAVARAMKTVIITWGRNTWKMPYCLSCAAYSQIDCICICICIYVYVYMCMYMYMHMYMYICVCICICICICIYVYVYVCVCIYIYIYINGGHSQILHITAPTYLVLLPWAVSNEEIFPFLECKLQTSKPWGPFGYQLWEENDNIKVWGSQKRHNPGKLSSVNFFFTLSKCSLSHANLEIYIWSILI
jgi:hypothetical protein